MQSRSLRTRSLAGFVACVLLISAVAGCHSKHDQNETAEKNLSKIGIKLPSDITDIQSEEVCGPPDRVDSDGTGNQFARGEHIIYEYERAAGQRKPPIYVVVHQLFGKGPAYGFVYTVDNQKRLTPVSEDRARELFPCMFRRTKASMFWEEEGKSSKRK